MDTYTLHRGTAPLLVSLPHNGTALPDDIAARLTPEARRVPDTDWHVAELYAFARELGASILVPAFSRYVVDLNRPDDDVSLYPGQNTTGLCPIVRFSGDPLYLPGQQPTAEEIAASGTTYNAVLLLEVVEHVPDVPAFLKLIAPMVKPGGVMLLSPQPRNFLFPDVMRTRVPIGPATVSLTDLVIIATALILAGVLVLIVRRTRLGMAMRATAENLAVARLMGIDVNRAIMAAFALGSALAAIAGLLWGGRFGQIDPLMGLAPGLKAFVACVIGGGYADDIDLLAARHGILFRTAASLRAW